MNSEQLKNLINRGNISVKFAHAFTGVVGTASSVFFKPSFPCTLIGIKLKTSQNSIAAEGIAVTKCADNGTIKYLTPDVPTQSDGAASNGTTLNTAMTATAIASSAIFTGLSIASGTSHFTNVDFVPGANNVLKRNISAAAGEVIRLDFDASATAAIIGLLELEFLPL